MLLVEACDRWSEIWDFPPVLLPDHRCSHSTRLAADRWADDIRLSDIEVGSFAPLAARASRGTGSSCGGAAIDRLQDQREL